MQIVSGAARPLVCLPPTRFSPARRLRGGARVQALRRTSQIHFPLFCLVGLRGKGGLHSVNMKYVTYISEYVNYFSQARHKPFPKPSCSVGGPFERRKVARGGALSPATGADDAPSRDRGWLRFIGSPTRHQLQGRGRQHVAGNLGWSAAY